MGMNPEKTGIRHKTQGVLFLGYKVWMNEMTIGVAERQRRTRTRLMFTIPVQKLFKKFSEKGFFFRAKKGNKKGSGERIVARRQDKWLFLQPYFIVQRFNAVVRGLVNYYSGSERLSDLYHVLYTLRRSAALTLAHHKKKKNAKWAFDTWGPSLKVFRSDLKTNQDKHIEFLWPSLESYPYRWHVGEVDKIARYRVEGFSLPKSMALVRSAKDLSCAIPGCENRADEWHHIKHKRRIGGIGLKNRAFVIAYARQIPVCKEHHIQIHSGKYDGHNLKKIPGYEE